MQLSISDIRLDGGTQPRAKIDPFKIDEYSEDMERGDSFPAVTVFHDGSAYWLADGFHRVRAAQKLGRTDIECDVKQGTRRDAVLHSVGANAKHGLRRTNEDKRRAAMTLLEDAEWSQWSNREIASRCCVSHQFINNLRGSLATVASEERTYTTKHGTVATMNTTNIGKASEPIKPPEQVVYDEAPEQIKQAVANEELTVKQAFDIHAYLKDAPQRFKDFVLRMRFKDTWRIEVTRSWFDSNNGDYSKFECVEKSGVLDWGDDDDGIDIRTCTLSELRIGEAQWKRAKRTINMEAAQKEREDRANELAKLAVLPNNIEVIHGDMLEVLATTDKRYDLVVADPPYNVTPYAWDAIGSDDVYLARVREWLIAIKGVLKPEYTMYWFCAAEYAARTELLLQELAYPIQSRIIWHRRNKAMGGKATRKYLSTWEMAYHVGNRDMNFPEEWDASWFDVQTHAVPQSNFNDENEKRHPTQKPFELIQNFVRFGSFPGDLVLDPFAGNGTTGRACYVEGNRQCTMIEQDKEYIDVIHSRYAA